MLMKKGPMQGNQGLPLLVSQLVGGSILLLIVLHTLLLYHRQASVDVYAKGTLD